MQERVQKILSQWGVVSRRQAEQMILAGRVCLNGNIVQLGQKADPAMDQIEVDGVPINPLSRPQPIYLLLNKPAGCVSTCSDPQNRQTVLDLLPPTLAQGTGIHPVGRLDTYSTGALLLTNDGALTFYLTHPSHHIPKVYRVWVEGSPAETTLQQWRQGVMLLGQRTLPAAVIVLDRHLDKTLLEITLYEGRNRQIRQVAEQLGHPVIQLHRTAIGSIQLRPSGKSELKIGAYRTLLEAEVCSLKAQINLPSVVVPVVREEYR